MSPTARLGAGLVVLGALLAGCGDALVGGRCAPGYAPRPGMGCVRLEDPDASATSDAGDLARDSAADGGTATEPCPVGRTRCGGACVNTDTDTAHCGACGVRCEAGAVCSRGTCAPECAAPLVACGGGCVDPNTDAAHCGACGHACPTGPCNGGQCRDTRAGHLVLIGHSYERTRPAQDRVVGNAVFLGTSSPVRVLVYEGLADAAPGGAIAHVNAAIDTVARARPWTRTVLGDPARLSAELSIDRYDVVLVHEQTHASDAQIAALAAQFGDALASFARAGGVVVVLDGPRHNTGTWPVACATGLIEATGATDVTDRTVRLAVPTDALAVGASTLYQAERTSVRFAGAAAYGVFLEGDEPVVLHRAVIP